MTMSRMIVGAVGGLAIVALAGPAGAQDSHVHIGHVMTGWTDTPNGQGLLEVAKQEAMIARQHAALAMSEPDNLESIRLHSQHVLHAVDPLATNGGPGLGYGLEIAAAGVAAHINLAAGAQGASDNVKLQAEHVAASARNVVSWSREIVRLIDQIMTNDNPKHANIMAGSVRNLLRCAAEGCDANSDGTIASAPGEGGLAQINEEMKAMMQGEGL